MKERGLFKSVQSSDNNSDFSFLLYNQSKIFGSVSSGKVEELPAHAGFLHSFYFDTETLSKHMETLQEAPDNTE